MKNTGIEYLSTEQAPLVIPEMSELLPPLPDEQLSLLEADILANGCYSPIVVMEDMTIVDGHNRYEICERHGIEYKIAVFSFEDILEAKAEANKGTRNDLRMNSAEGFTSVDTKQELAEAVGVSRDTINKVIQIDENAPEVVKDALDNKEISVNKGYEITKKLKDVPEDELEETAIAMIEADYRKANDELLTPDEVRLLDNKYAILFIRGARPVKDLKYDLKLHPNISYSSDGGAGIYRHGKNNFMGSPLFQFDYKKEILEYE